MRALTNQPCRGVAGATLALTLVVTVFVGDASASAATKRSDGDEATTSRTVATTSTTGDRGSAAASTPAAPQLLTASGLRPLTRAQADRLTGAQGLHGSACEIDFDDDAAISLLPGNAVDTFAYSPWWNQLCGGNYARVYPTDISHFHLGYVDPAVQPCYDSENPYDTPVGAYARGEDCEPIDTVTEPRSHITSHEAAYHHRLDLIDAYGSDYAPRAFTLERVRVLTDAVRVCYRMPPDGPWIAAAPVGPFDKPGLVYCWASLSPGLWDLSAWTSGTVGVDFTGAGNLPWTLDDIRLG